MKIKKYYNFTICALAFLAGILLATAMLLVNYEVFMRYFLNYSAAWVIEVCELILLFITFLGAAWLLKEDGHVTVDIVHSHLNQKTRAVLDIGTSILALVVCLVLTWYSAASTVDHLQREATLVRSLTLPKGMLMVVIPLGFLMVSIQFFIRAWGYTKNWGAPMTDNSEPGEDK